MKNYRTHYRKFIAFFLVLSLVITQPAHAHPFFGSEIEWLGTQHAYNDVCQEYGMKRTYFFGILVSEEMVFKTISCPESDPREG